MVNYASTQLQFGTTTRQLYFREKSTDESVIQQIFFDQQYDMKRLGRTPELIDYLARQGAKGLKPLVIDAGANIGASPVYFTAILPDALVVAVEPDRENFNLLAKNVEGINVTPIHAAISSTTGRARVTDPGQGHWGYRTQSLADNDATGEAVPRVTINDLYRSHPAPYFPFLVKVDIEGGEMDLFSANTEWVARTPVVIVELHDWLMLKGGTSRPFLQCISKLDRDFVYIGEDIYSIANDLDGLAAADC
ncbi:MAG: hypothetical protein QOG83_412 [Alphaproteobacteria bacterium]|nr:hypothetical protein [Alphaproteobacteria bacterium]